MIRRPPRSTHPYTRFPYPPLFRSGRMLARAAARLGYHCHIYAPEADPPAAEVAARFTRGEYTDAVAMAAFAKSCAVVTYEFENIPFDPVAALARRGY